MLAASLQKITVHFGFSKLQIHLNVKIILAYLYIIKTIQNLLPLRVSDAFLAFLRVLLALNLSHSLDFSKESPRVYVKFRIPFFNERCFLCHPNFNSISSSISDFKVSSLMSSLLSLPCFPSSLFLMLCSYELKINKLHKIELISNSVLFNDAISLKNKTLDKIVKESNPSSNCA